MQKNLWIMAYPDFSKMSKKELQYIHKMAISGKISCSIETQEKLEEALLIK